MCNTIVSHDLLSSAWGCGQTCLDVGCTGFLADVTVDGNSCDTSSVETIFPMPEGTPATTRIFTNLHPRAGMLRGCLNFSQAVDL